jgi:RNA polymerase sigma-70 factor (ECF subfamily)
MIRNSSSFDSQAGRMNQQHGHPQDDSSRSSHQPPSCGRLSWEEVVRQHRQKLRRMIEFRMNPRLRGRVDASDVVQDTFIEAARVMENTGQQPDLPVHVWLRRLANQKLIQAHRQHLGAACRAAGREQRTPAEASSCSIARFLVGNFTSPSNAAIRDEKQRLLEVALEQMDPLDREVLTLRHFEQLSGPESAEVLEVSHDVVKKRYVRALEKLQRIMASAGVIE